MILHTVKTSPFQNHSLSDCLKLMTDKDTLLLIEDAVIATQAVHQSTSALELLSQQGRLMVLDADLAARGVNNRIGQACSYVDFVELTIVHKSQLAW